MALKDMMRDAARSTMNAATGAVQNAAQDMQSQGAMGVATGLFGGYTELTPEAATQQYGMYLLQGESFTRVFALLRDKMLFTNMRIIFIDHQGATGVKTTVDSINLKGIISVKLETGGLGFDHAEVELGYIATPHSHMETKKLEFPNGFNVQELYCLLEQYANENTTRLLG